MQSKDLGLKSSGDIGYCHYKKSSRGILIDWDGDTVIAVDCDYDICGFSCSCDLYNRRPVGFTQTYPKSPKPVENE